MSKIIDGIAKDLKAVPEKLKAQAGNVDKKKLFLMSLPYIGLSTLFQTNFFRLFFRYCTGV